MGFVILSTTLSEVDSNDHGGQHQTVDLSK